MMNMDRRRQPRDEQGIRVPRRGTKAYRIYCWMQQKRPPTNSEMAQRLGVSYNSVAMLLWKMRHPDKNNAMHRVYCRAWYARNKSAAARKEAAK